MGLGVGSIESSMNGVVYSSRFQGETLLFDLLLCLGAWGDYITVDIFCWSFWK